MEDLSDRIEDQLFGVQRSVRYHSKRVNFFARLMFFNGKVCLYRELMIDFISLEQEYVKLGEEITESELSDLTCRRLEIEKREPHTLRVLNTICHNELCHARGQDEYAFKVTWIQRLLSDFGDWFYRSHVSKLSPSIIQKCDDFICGRHLKR